MAKILEQTYPCPRCRGKNKLCLLCGGTGRISQRQRIKLDREVQLVINDGGLAGLERERSLNKDLR